MKAKSRIAAVALTSSLIFGFSQPVAFASGCTGFAQGDGSAQSPYLVSSAASLTAVANCLATGNHFKQTADIDLGGQGSPFVRIGSQANPFRGNYDGDNYEIQNLYFSGAGYAGLFGSLDGATVTQVKIKNGAIESTNSFAGLLAGYITNSTVSDIVLEGSVSSTSLVGGLTGMTQSTRSFIDRIMADVTVTTTNGNAGGLIGQVEFQSATVQDVFVKGSVNTNNGQMSGGVVGYGISPIIRRAVSVATVTGAQNHRGGLIGNMVNTSTLEDSFYLDTAVISIASNFGVSKTSVQLKDVATFTNFSIGTTAQANNIWRIVAGSNSDYPYLASSTIVNAPPAPAAPAPYEGPVISARASEQVHSSGTKVVLDGERLTTITSVEISGVKQQFKLLGSSQIEIQLDASHVSGAVDLVIASSFGKLTVQDALTVTGASESANFWTKRTDSKVSIYAKNLAGLGKVQFLVNGKEVAWIRASSSADSRLSSTGLDHYFVRTKALSSGKNRFEILVSGKRVWFATYSFMG